MTQTELLQTIEFTTQNLAKNTTTTLFNETILKATDQTLSLLGNEGNKAFYKLLENRYRLKATQIPERIEIFTEAIEDTFGQAAHLIEIRIMRSIHESVPNFEIAGNEQLSFTEYVESLRKFL